MELQIVNNQNGISAEITSGKTNQEIGSKFIEANTQLKNYSFLREKNIIPAFAKDNEPAICTQIL